MCRLNVRLMQSCVCVCVCVCVLERAHALLEEWLYVLSCAAYSCNFLVHVLFTYCPFHVLVQINFRRYYFYFLSDQAQTHLDRWKVLDEHWSEFSFKSQNGYRLPPLTPIVNIARFRQRYRKRAIFKMGVYGGNSSSVVESS